MNVVLGSVRRESLGRWQLGGRVEHAERFGALGSRRPDRGLCWMCHVSGRVVQRLLHLQRPRVVSLSLFAFRFFRFAGRLLGLQVVVESVAFRTARHGETPVEKHRRRRRKRLHLIVRVVFVHLVAGRFRESVFGEHRSAGRLGFHVRRAPVVFLAVGVGRHYTLLFVRREQRRRRDRSERIAAAAAFQHLFGHENRSERFGRDAAAAAANGGIIIIIGLGGDDKRGRDVSHGRRLRAGGCVQYCLLFLRFQHASEFRAVQRPVARFHVVLDDDRRRDSRVRCRRRVNGRFLTFGRRRVSHVLGRDQKHGRRRRPHDVRRNGRIVVSRRSLVVYPLFVHRSEHAGRVRRRFGGRPVQRRLVVRRRSDRRVLYVVRYVHVVFRVFVHRKLGCGLSVVPRRPVIFILRFVGRTGFHAEARDDQARNHYYGAQLHHAANKMI